MITFLDDNKIVLLFGNTDVIKIYRIEILVLLNEKVVPNLEHIQSHLKNFMNERHMEVT